MAAKFCIQRNTDGLPREALAIINAKRDWIIRAEAEPDCIPIGSVEFCEPVFGRQPGLKQFYPEFLHHLMGRAWGVVSQPRAYRTAFYKDATRWKSDFVARVYQQGEEFPVTCELMYESEVVRFFDEWRFYIANGHVIDVGLYAGWDDTVFLSDAKLDRFVKAIPRNFSGAVDIGVCADGELRLVECHPPFACGWYGDDCNSYAMWMEQAWECREFWIREGK